MTWRIVGIDHIRTPMSSEQWWKNVWANDELGLTKVLHQGEVPE